MQIQWGYEARATPNGQLALFAEFLKTSGVYQKWDERRPDHLRLTGSASSLRAIPGGR
jgi:hypothetical protein